MSSSIGSCQGGAALTAIHRYEGQIDLMTSMAGFRYEVVDRQRQLSLIKRVPDEHAGGKWRLSYTGATGRSGTLEVDVNFLLRVPLWPTVRADSRRMPNMNGWRAGSRSPTS